MGTITAKILNSKKDRIVQTGEVFLDVEVAILEEGKKKPLEIRKIGYALETTEKEIEKDIKKMVAEFVESRERSEKNEKADAAEAKADKVIENLKGKEIS